MSELVVVPKRKTDKEQSQTSNPSGRSAETVELPPPIHSIPSDTTSTSTSSPAMMTIASSTVPRAHPSSTQAPSSVVSTINTASTQPMQRLMTPEELEAQTANTTTDTASAANTELGAEAINMIVNYDESEDYRAHSQWDLVRSKGFRAKLKWFGYKCANGADRVGAVLNSIFGVDDNNYQYVIDAAERMEAERREREEAERVEQQQAMEGEDYLRRQRQDFDAAIADAQAGTEASSNTEGRGTTTASVQRLQMGTDDGYNTQEDARLAGMLYSGQTGTDTRGEEQKRLDSMLYGA